MFTFIVRRLVSGAVMLAVISLVAFSLLYLGGGDMARNILGENATEEVVAQKAAELGLDRPLFAQYAEWLTSALGGDLGTSWFTGQLVSVSLATRLPVTLTL